MGERKKKNNPLVAILLGPAMGFVAVSALWHNEGRFDYYKAAKATTPIEDLSGSESDVTVSMTGVMDRALTLDGDYVKSFTGYLTVYRSAEIYAWEEHRDSDGTTYSLDWNSSVESISRNNGVQQVLHSGSFAPEEYEVGDWKVDGDRLAFVNRHQEISPGNLVLSAAGDELLLRPEGGYFYLRKGEPKNLGDERISYSGVPVPETATYFGLLSNDRGIAHVAEVKTSWISGMIGDTGLLHHLAAGDRETALKSVKAHLVRIKWMVRIFGTVVTVLGYLIFFSGLFSILLYIPIVNRLAELGIWVASLILGLTTSLVTITASYIINHPIVLLTVVALIGGVVFYSRRRRRESQAVVQQALTEEFGHAPSARELTEKQFVGMARVAMADDRLDEKEEKLLRSWAEKRDLSDDDITRLLGLAKLEAQDAGVGSEQDLTLQIQLALADQDLSPFELKRLFLAGEQLGLSREQVRQRVTQAQAA